MTKSKFSILGFWFLLLVTTYSALNFLSVSLELLFGVTFLKPLTLTHGQSDDLIFQVVIFSFLTILLAPIVFFNAIIITIDSLNKTILFKNFFTKKTRFYIFTELDGFVDTDYKDGYQAKFDIVYLVKKDKRIEKISSYFYSNYKALKSSLDQLTYLGYRDFGLIKNLKILFRQSVVD